MKNKEVKTGLVIIILLVILVIGFLAFKGNEIDIINDTPTEVLLNDGQEVLRNEIQYNEALAFEGAEVLPEAEVIPLIEVCFKVPVGAEAEMKNMSWVVIHRWLADQKQADIEAVDLQIRSNMDSIREANLPK